MSPSEQLTWITIFGPAVGVAVLISVDNLRWGPYFALADIVLGDPVAGTSLRDRGVLWALTRRIVYLFAAGILLSAAGQPSIASAYTFFLAGFLLVWPAFLRPLPNYTNRGDWQVVTLWVLYVLACVAFGLAGANTGALITIATGDTPIEFARQNFVSLIVSGFVGIVTTAFRQPVASSLNHRARDRYDDEMQHRE